MKNKKKHHILFLQGTSEIGGSDISLMRMIEVLDRDQFQPYAVLPSEGPLVEKLKERGCEVFFLPQMLKATTRKGIFYFFRFLINYPFAANKIAKLAKEKQIDLMHTNTLHNFYGFLASKLAGCAHVMHVREIVMHSRWFRGLEVWMAKTFTTRLIVTSDAVAEMFGKRPEDRPKHLVKIPNSIDVEQYDPDNDGQQVLQDLQIKEGTPVFGLVCRLDHWKGVDVFLKAAQICHQKNPDARYLVVGGPIEGREDYAEQMYQLSESLGLRDCVIFTQWKYGPQQMPQVHAALTGLVLASRWPEPFGLVLLEAMASAKPVIATNHGGPTEICVQNETAFLVEPKNQQAMADAMLELIDHPEKAKQMGQAGRQRVLELFDRKVCIKKLEKLYLEILSEKKVCVAS